MNLVKTKERKQRKTPVSATMMDLQTKPTHTIDIIILPGWWHLWSSVDRWKQMNQWPHSLHLALSQPSAHLTIFFPSLSYPLQEDVLSPQDTRTFIITNSVQSVRGETFGLYFFPKSNFWVPCPLYCCIFFNWQQINQVPPRQAVPQKKYRP